MTRQPSIATCLWFEANGIDAARFYVDLIDGSRLLSRVPEGANPMIVDFELAGVPYRILNGGPHYKLNPACSIAVTTPGQAETDHRQAAGRAQAAMMKMSKIDVAELQAAFDGTGG